MLAGYGVCCVGTQTTKTQRKHVSGDCPQGSVATMSLLHIVF